MRGFRFGVPVLVLVAVTVVWVVWNVVVPVVRETVPQVPNPAPASVPAGFTAWRGGWCAAAFPSGWRQDNGMADGPIFFRGGDGEAFVDTFTELHPTRPDRPLPKFVGVYAGTALTVVSRRTVHVAGARAGFELRLVGADGSTWLLTHGYDQPDGKGCWLVVTPAGAAAERIAATLAVGAG